MYNSFFFGKTIYVIECFNLKKLKLIPYEYFSLKIEIYTIFFSHEFLSTFMFCAICLLSFSFFWICLNVQIQRDNLLYYENISAIVQYNLTDLPDWQMNVFEFWYATNFQFNFMHLQSYCMYMCNVYTAIFHRYARLTYSNDFWS